MLTLPPLRTMLPWLTAQPWKKEIGRRVDCRACPIAVWLGSVFRESISIDEDTITIGDVGAQGLFVFSTPHDYIELISRIDYAGIASRSVTVQEAYDALKAVLREQEEAEDGAR